MRISSYPLLGTIAALPKMLGLLDVEHHGMFHSCRGIFSETKSNNQEANHNSLTFQMGCLTVG